MKKRTLLFMCGLAMMLSFGVFSLSSADPEDGDNPTWDTTACILSSDNGHVVFGSRCAAPGPGPCTTVTLCN